MGKEYSKIGIRDDMLMLLRCTTQYKKEARQGYACKLIDQFLSAGGKYNDPVLIEFVNYFFYQETEDYWDDDEYDDGELETTIIL